MSNKKEDEDDDEEEHFLTGPVQNWTISEKVMLGVIILVGICIIVGLLFYFDIISWNNFKKRIGLVGSKTQTDDSKIIVSDNAVNLETKTTAPVDRGPGGPGGPGGYDRWAPHTSDIAEHTRLRKEEAMYAAQQEAMFAAKRAERNQFEARIRPGIEAKKAEILSNLSPSELAKRELDARYASALGK